MQITTKSALCSTCGAPTKTTSIAAGAWSLPCEAQEVTVCSFDERHNIQACEITLADVQRAYNQACTAKESQNANRTFTALTYFNTLLERAPASVRQSFAEQKNKM